MIARYEEQGRRSGARIAHSGGFDSIRSDLGVHFLQRPAFGAWQLHALSGIGAAP